MHACDCLRAHASVPLYFLMSVYLMRNEGFVVPDGKAQFDFLIHDLSHPLYLSPPLSGSGAQA